MHREIVLVSEEGRARFTLEPRQTGVQICEVCDHHLPGLALGSALPALERARFRFLAGPRLFGVGFEMGEELLLCLEVLVAALPSADQCALPRVRTGHVTRERF